MKLMKMLTATALVALAGTAQAATYVASRAVGAGTVNLSITTDDTIGVLASGNITAYSILVTDPSGSFTLNKGNSAVNVTGSNFTATATSLIYNFSPPGYALFQSPMVGSSGPFYCLQGSTGSCFDFIGAAEGLDSQNCCGSVERSARTGPFLVATAAVTPGVLEPATWAMMIAGFGLVGGAVRRRKVLVSFA